MIPVLPPPALGHEIAACTVLGACTGAVRAFFPVKGRGAFLPDLIWTGLLLAAAQSYAAGESLAGVLRWYMIAAAFAGAGTAAFVLGIPLKTARKRLQPARNRHRKRKQARKVRRNAERAAKKRKKNLPNRRRMLYNSYVSK